MKKALIALFCLILISSLASGLASCGKAEFDISFIVDGELYATVYTSGEEIIKMPGNPKKEGYTFDGWYRDKDTWQRPFAADSLLDTPISSDMSVYAKFTDNSEIKGTELELHGFEKTEDASLGTVYYVSVPNARVIYSLNEAVTVNSKSKWTVSKDSSGNNTIASKSVELSAGNNVFFLTVEDEFSNIQQYVLLIRRRPMYTVTFDTDGGTAAESVTVEEGLTASAPDTHKKGYTLSGWSYDFTSPITKDETVTALWVANKYDITYDANGGSVAHEKTEVTYDSSYTLEIPERVGYNFEGWYLGEDLVEDGIWTLDFSVTLAAKWKVLNYEIEYELNGGTVDGMNPETYTVEDEFMLTNPTKTGYEFLGWTYEDATEPTLSVTVSNKVGALNFVANFKANTYTITLDANGGSLTNNTIEVEYDGEFELPTPTHATLNFSGWYYNNALVEDGTFTHLKSITLVAKWHDGEMLTITFDSNGGTAVAPVTVAQGELISPPTTTRFCHRFNGWYISGTSIKWDFDTPVTENMELKAHWVPTLPIDPF